MLDITNVAVDLKPLLLKILKIAEVRRDDFSLINWSSYLINLDE